MPKGGGGRMKMKVPNMAGGGQALQAAMARQMAAQQEAQQKVEDAKTAATGSTDCCTSTGCTSAQVSQPVQQQKVNPQNIPPHVLAEMRRRQMQRQPPPSWYNGDERHRSIVLYPIYINSFKTVAGGRRVPKEFCVPRPHVREMFMILKDVGYECVMVPKCHPRDNFKGDPNNLGRIHILFKNQEGEPLKPEIAKNKVELLKYVGGKIPLLKSRQPGYQPEDEQPKQSQPDQNQNKSASAAPQQQKSSAKGKGKRKKRR